MKSWLIDDGSLGMCRPYIKLLFAATPATKLSCQDSVLQEHARLLKRDFEQLKLPVVVHLVDDKIFYWS